MSAELERISASENILLHSRKFFARHKSEMQRIEETTATLKQSTEVNGITIDSSAN